MSVDFLKVPVYHGDGLKEDKDHGHKRKISGWQFTACHQTRRNKQVQEGLCNRSKVGKPDRKQDQMQKDKVENGIRLERRHGQTKGGDNFNNQNGEGYDLQDKRQLSVVVDLLCVVSEQFHVGVNFAKGTADGRFKEEVGVDFMKSSKEVHDDNRPTHGVEGSGGPNLSPFRVAVVASLNLLGQKYETDNSDHILMVRTIGLPRKDCSDCKEQKDQEDVILVLAMKPTDHVGYQ